MKNNTLILFPIIILLALIVSCGNKSSEESNQSSYDYSGISEFKANTNKKQLIYEILNRAVVKNKDIPDYNLIGNKKKIYIYDSYFSNFRDRKLKKSEIPKKIEKVEFIIKSISELQTLANNSNNFLYLTLGEIEIIGNSAKIGLSNEWVVSERNKGVYGVLSGGGYVLNFRKKSGRWVFDRDSENSIWQY